MTSTQTQHAPGELFTARDGNRGSVTDARYPAVGEPQDFLLDADGNEIRKGDHVLILDGHDWAGKICVVDRVERATMYPHDSSLGFGHDLVRVEDSKRLKAWSPSAGINSVGITHRRTSWAARPHKVRKLDLTDEADKRLKLMDLYDLRAQLDTKFANLEGERARISAEIDALQRSITRD